MSIDIYILCNTEFLTSNVERTCEDLTAASSLEDAINLKPDPENKEGLKYYFSLCLGQIQEKGMEISMSYLKIIDESFELFTLAPEHKPTFFITLDEIFTKLIRKTNDENEILKCAGLASKLRNLGNEGPSSLSIAYTKLTPFIYRTFSICVSTPKRTEYLKILDILTKGVEYGLDFHTLAKRVAKYALEFLEDANNINQDQENPQESPKEDMEIIRYIEKLNINDGDFKTRLGALKKKISSLILVPIKPIIPPPVLQTINFEELKIKPEPEEIYTRTHHDFKVRILKGLYRNKIVAVKIYSAKSYNFINKFEKEIENNVRLNNSSEYKNCCFIKFYGHYRRENNDYCEIGLVMKHVEKTLMYYITELKKNNNKICEGTLMEMYKLLINSFTVMHDLKIYHLDIKPHNILIKNTINRDIKLYIIDLGCSEKLHDGELESESVGELRLIQGTMGYMSPEIVNELNQQKTIAKYKRSKADVFSLGMTLLQICTLDNLYGGLNTSSKNDQLLSLVENVPFEWARNAIKKMLRINPNQRPKFIDLKKEIKNAETWTFSISNSSSLLETSNFGSLELENPLKSAEMDKFTVDYFLKKIKQELILIKSYSISSPEILNKLSEEIEIYKKLSQLKSSNFNCFLKYYEASSFHNSRKGRKNICAIMQYCEKSLMDYITMLKNGNKIIISSLMLNMCKGLIFSFASMHDIGIYHLNIKPHNILIDENQNLFITGFGTLHKKIEELERNNYGRLIQNTVGYEPPEIINRSGVFNNEQMKKIDVFSLGITFLQMLTLESLANCRYTDPMDNELLLLINKIPHDWAKDMVQHMIAYNPEDRPSFTDLMKEIRNIETLTYSNQ